MPSTIFPNVIHSKNYLKVGKHLFPMVAEKENAARWKRTFRFGRPTSEILDKHVHPESRSGRSSKSLLCPVEQALLKYIADQKDRSLWKRD